MKSMEEMIAAAQKAAETIQSQMNDMQAKLDAIEVEGTAGGGLVKVRASARGRIIGVTIDESLLTPEEKQIIEDLVAASTTPATRPTGFRARKCRRSRAGWACRPGSICRGWGRRSCSAGYWSVRSQSSC